MNNGPIAVLATDFGINDRYVASMKGVILSIAPRANIVDLSHEITRHSISEAAYLLWSTYTYFPRGTLFVNVVDPGVGTSRNILCMVTKDYTFLSPDNGVLKFVLAASRTNACFKVTNRRLYSKEVSSTFHGRDIFAPVAAHLLNGTNPKELGPRAKPEYGKEHFVPVTRHATGQKLSGYILHVDRFGNIVTNYFCKKLPAYVSIRIGSKTVSKSFPAYAVAGRSPFVVKGSSGLLEISVRNGNAAKILSARQDQPLTLSINEHEKFSSPR